MKGVFARLNGIVIMLFSSVFLMLLLLIVLIFIENNSVVIIVGSICFLLLSLSILLNIHNIFLKVCFDDSGMKFYFSKKRITYLKWDDVADCSFHRGKWSYYFFRSKQNIEFTIDYSKRVKELIDKFAPLYIKEGFENPIQFKSPKR